MGELQAASGMGRVSASLTLVAPGEDLRLLAPLSGDVSHNLSHCHLPCCVHVLPWALVRLFGALVCPSGATLLPLCLFLDKLEEMITKLRTTRP